MTVNLTEARTTNRIVRIPTSWLLGWAAATAIGLLLFSYRYLDRITNQLPSPVLDPLLSEMTAVYGAALMLPILIRFIRAKPLVGGDWVRHIPAYIAVAMLFGIAHTTWMWASRAVLFPLVGLGTYHYGTMPHRYAMEFPIQLLIFGITVGFVMVLDRYRAARERELHTSQLEASLTRAQLQALQAQLQPHFLFNALNTISSTMYENLDAADRMITRLSDLLRHALLTTRSQTIPLREELVILEPYLDVMRARFGPLLEVEIAVEEEVRDASVPTLLLQPLVENAAQHGAPAPPEPARIEIGAYRRIDMLVVYVRDNGPGAEPSADLIGAGMGLSNVAERLRALYRNDAKLVWENLPAGGFQVEVTLPFRIAESATPAARMA